MKNILLCGVLSALALIVLPSPRVEAGEAENVVLRIEAAKTETEEAKIPEEEAEAEAGVRLLLSDGVVTVEEDEYLTAVVLSEMPAEFETEALKAQAVAARTFLARKLLAGKHEGAEVCAESGCCQAWTGKAELEEKFGADFDAVWAKAAEAVTETAGEILTYNGAPIDAVYFSCSGGRTEAAVAVWGTEVPYLQAVDSPGEQAALRYESEVCFTEDELREILLAAEPDCALIGAAGEWFGEVSYTEGGGVESMMIGGTRFSGTALRGLLGLNSTRFTVEADAGMVRFDVLGFGHRVGMSQYGANAMAQLGFDYQTILRYYYRGAQIKKVSQDEA